VRETIAALCEQVIDPDDLIREVAERVGRVVPYDTASWMRTDPETLLPVGLLTLGTAPADGIEMAKARNEFVDRDLNRFADLDQARRSVATLAATTDGVLDRSARHRMVYAPRGLNDELRLLARSGTSTWALACLVRGADWPVFTVEESRYVVEIARYLGDGLRRNLAGFRYAPSASGGRGMLVLDDAGRIEAATPEATRWLSLLPSRVPLSMVALQAQANAAGSTGRAARVRLRLPSGGWLLIHADVLVAEPGAAAKRVAVMLEPAGPSEMLPLLMALHGFTDREREVTGQLLAGHGTDQIAERLHLSRHTLRDHVKAIFAKAGVGSRAELTAVLGGEPHQA
jgi:DNA-binding CsgD family transcriptional regulator